MEGDAAVTGGTRQAEASSADFSPSLNWEEPEGEAVAERQRGSGSLAGHRDLGGSPPSPPRSPPLCGLQ